MTRAILKLILFPSYPQKLAFVEVAESPIIVFVSPKILEDHMGNLDDAPRLEINHETKFCMEKVGENIEFDDSISFNRYFRAYLYCLTILNCSIPLG